MLPSLAAQLQVLGQSQPGTNEPPPPPGVPIASQTFKNEFRTLKIGGDMGKHPRMVQSLPKNAKSRVRGSWTPLPPPNAHIYPLVYTPLPNSRWLGSKVSKWAPFTCLHTPHPLSCARGWCSPSALSPPSPPTPGTPYTRHVTNTNVRQGNRLLFGIGLVPCAKW